MTRRPLFGFLVAAVLALPTIVGRASGQPPLIVGCVEFGIPTRVKIGTSDRKLLSGPGSDVEFFDHTQIRPIFERVGNSWRSMRSGPFPTESIHPVSSRTYEGLKSLRTWRVYFSGKEAAQVSGEWSTKETEWPYLVFDEANEAKIPRLEVGADRIWHFEMREHGVRPLVASTREAGGDPDHWRPGALSAELEAGLLERFKRIKRASKNKAWKSEDPHRQYAWKSLKAEQVKVVKAFRSDQGTWLIGMELKSDVMPIDMDLAGEDFYTRWFVVKDGQWKLLPYGGIPLDALDFDGDGRSEWVFVVSKYNRGGYRLYGHDFELLSETEWSFH